MPGRVLVDSSFFIDRIRTGRDPLEELSAYADDWEMLTCGVVGVEVLRGLKHRKAHQRMNEYLGCMLFVPTLNAVWNHVAKLTWDLDRMGRIIKVPDLVIATCALQSEAAVLTLDSDFSMVPGLRTLRELV